MAIEIKWKLATFNLPECKNWDIDREAFYSERVLTYSPTHGFKECFGRKDKIFADGPLKGREQYGNTFKWGVNGNDYTITHWVYCNEITPQI